MPGQGQGLCYISLVEASSSYAMGPVLYHKDNISKFKLKRQKLPRMIQSANIGINGNNGQWEALIGINALMPYGQRETVYSSYTHGQLRLTSKGTRYAYLCRAASGRLLQLGPQERSPHGCF